MKRKFSVILALVIILCTVFTGCQNMSNLTGVNAGKEESRIVTGGDCGENAKWTFYDSGLLEIYGSGDMYDYDLFFNLSPWYAKAGNVESVKILDGITSIGSSAFFDCEALKTVDIPTSVKRIGDNAFVLCSSLESIDIPTSITSIGNEVFDCCSSLTTINVASDNPNYCNENGILFNKDRTTLIRFPEAKKLTEYSVPSYVTCIDNGAFSHCGSLETVNIPSSVTSIGESAFSYCGALTSIVIPSSVTYISDMAFQNCDVLASIDIPSSVTGFGSSAFRNCLRLKSIDIPSSVTDIGEWAFANCSSLTSVDIPSSVSVIGNSAFLYCRSLTSVYFYGNAPTLIYDMSLDGYWFEDDIKIYYIEGKEGWTNPWYGYDVSTFVPEN